MGKKEEVSEKRNDGEAYVKLWPVQGTQTHPAGTKGIGWRKGIESRKLEKKKCHIREGPMRLKLNIQKAKIMASGPITL